jgi:nitrate reductase delta subunit
MDRTLRALAALLTYPDEALVAAVPEIRAHVAAAPRLRKAARRSLARLADYLEGTDLMSLQERYVAQFDTGRGASLHLFEHVHGDSRDRGQAMVDLREKYRAAGLELAAHELPDFLPALLEYLSLRERGELLEMLGDCAHILRAVGERLRDRDSPYDAVFAALLDVAREPGFAAAKAAVPEEKSLDEEWAEEPAFGGCPAASKASQSVIRFVPKPRPTGDRPWNS